MRPDAHKIKASRAHRLKNKVTPIKKDIMITPQPQLPDFQELETPTIESQELKLKSMLQFSDTYTSRVLLESEKVDTLQFSFEIVNVDKIRGLLKNASYPFIYAPDVSSENDDDYLIDYPELVHSKLIEVPRENLVYEVASVESVTVIGTLLEPDCKEEVSIDDWLDDVLN